MLLNYKCVCFVGYVLLISILFITRHEGETQKERERS